MCAEKRFCYSMGHKLSRQNFKNFLIIAVLLQVAH